LGVGARMKGISLLVMVFVSFAFALFVSMYDVSTNPTAVSFPTFTAPTVSFGAIPTDCSLLGCVAYVGQVIVNIVIGIVFVVLLLVALVVYIVSLFVFIGTHAFTGVRGAPNVINALLTLPSVFTIGMVLYKLIRKGEDSAA
jgi:hypothetical protein